MSHRSRLATIFIITSAVLMASLTTDFVVDIAAIKTNHRVAQDQVTIGHIRDLVSALADAETGQRGYLLTGQERYLEPYNIGVAQARTGLAELGQSVGTRELSAADIAEIARLVAVKLDELNETVTLRRTRGLPAALQAVETERGKQAMDALRAQAAAMIAQQESNLEASSTAPIVLSIIARGSSR
jgi:CHASE3 domain sensor protein